MNIKNNLKRFAKGFVYAFSGIIASVKSERNLRFHFCAAFYVILFMNFYEFEKCEKAVIFLTIGLVIGFELLNTSVERCVDLLSPQYHPLAKKAKDAAAGAVLCLTLSAAAIGIVFFWDLKAFDRIFRFFSGNIIALIGLIISAVIWFVFIFLVKTDKKNVKKIRK
ncbi:diacylglycerol kinase family protein [Ruminococcus sp. Marseille-P6503]|uniref:diacylglycerol kinase family protein n=1 Tax=Ruminococcus sp. Marseille-P6503 TaxID=2364796 RepID=UPI000F52FC0A|nr:diacylglycerol kinase family protein [Ruminococcus sp. Marseille-P6503]